MGYYHCLHCKNKTKQNKAKKPVKLSLLLVVADNCFSSIFPV